MEQEQNPIQPVQNTNQTDPPKNPPSDFMGTLYSNTENFIRSGGDPGRVPVFSMLGDIKLREMEGESFVFPDKETARKAFADKIPADQFDDFYKRYEGIYDAYQSNRDRLVPNNLRVSNPFHWSNIEQFRGYSRKQPVGIDPFMETEESRYLGSTNVPLRTDLQYARSSGKYLDQHGNIRDIDPNTDPAKLTLGTIKEKDGSETPYLREIPHVDLKSGGFVFTENIGPGNIPIGQNWSEGDQGLISDIYHGIPAGLIRGTDSMNRFLYGGVRIIDKFINSEYYDAEDEKLEKGKKALEDIISGKSLSPAAIDYLYSSSSEVELANIIKTTSDQYERIEDNPAWQALQVIRSNKFVEEYLYGNQNKGIIDRIIQKIDFDMESQKWNTSANLSDHGFIGGSDGFNLGSLFANTLITGAEFLVPQILTGGVAGKLATSLPGLVTNVAGKKVLTQYGRNTVRAIQSSQIASQIGGITTHDAVLQGIPEDDAELIGLAAALTTFGVEYMVGTNWIAKLYGNTYFNSTLKSEIRSSFTTIAKEKGFDLKHLTAEQAEELGKEVGKRARRFMFSPKFSKKAGQEAVDSGAHTASEGWPAAFRLIRGYNEKMPGFAQGAVGETVQESMEYVGETFIQRIYDKYFAEDGATAGDGKFGVELFSDDWWHGFFESAAGGFAMGGVAGLFIKNKRVLNETLFEYIATGKSQQAIQAVEELRKTGSFGPTHKNMRGEIITDAVEDKKSANDQIADLFVQDINHMVSIAERFKINEKIDEEGVKSLLASKEGGHFAIIKGALAAKVTKEKVDSKIAELESSNDNSSPEFNEKLASLKNQSNMLEMAYRDHINGNISRNIMMREISSAMGFNPIKTTETKNTHKRAYERWALEMEKYNSVMDETSEKRKEVSSKISEIISSINQLGNDQSNIEDVVKKISELASTQFSQGQVSSKEANDLQGAINKFSSSEEARLGGDEFLNTMSSNTAHGKLISMGGTPEGKFDRNLAGLQAGFEPNAPKLSEFLIKEFSDIAYVGNNQTDYISMSNELTEMAKRIDQGMVGQNDLANIKAMLSILDSNKELVDISINALNKIDKKYAFEYVQTDTDVKRDMSASAINEEMSNEIKNKIEENAKLANDIFEKLNSLEDIRQERSNEYMVNASVIDSMLFKAIAGSIKQDISAKLTEEIKRFILDSRRLKSKEGTIAQEDYDKLFELSTSIKGQLYELINASKEIYNETVTSSIENVIKQLSLTDSEIKSNYGDVSYTSGNIQRDIDLLASALAQNEDLSTNDFIKVNSKYDHSNLLRHLLFKIAKDNIKSIARADARKVRKGLEQNYHPAGQSLNYQQELVLFQLYGWYKESQSGNASKSSIPFHVSGYAGTGKTTVIVKNLVQIIAREKGGKVKLAISAPSSANLNSFENSLKINERTDYFDLVKIPLDKLMKSPDLQLDAQDADILIIDESHILSSLDNIKSVYKKGNGMPVLFMGDNRQLPSSDGKGPNQKSFEIHPAYTISERSLSMYEMYRSGNSEIIKLQDDLGRYIEGGKPISGSRPAWRIKEGTEYLFNDLSGVQFVQTNAVSNKVELYFEFAKAIMQDIVSVKQTGTNIIVTIDQDDNKSTFNRIKSILEREIKSNLSPEQEKILKDSIFTLDIESSEVSKSILGGSAANVFVGNADYEFQDPLFYARFLLTASTRAVNKVVVPTSNQINVATNRVSNNIQHISPGSFGNEKRSKEWMESLKRQDPSRTAPSQATTPEINPNDFKFKINEIITKDNKRYALLDIFASKRYLLGEIGANNQIITKFELPSANVDNTFKSESAKPRVYATMQTKVNYNDEFSRGNWWMFNMTTHSEESLSERASFFDKTGKKKELFDTIVADIKSSKFYTDIVDALNELPDDARDNILTGRNNAAQTIEEHAFNETLRALRYQVLNAAPIGAEIEFFVPRTGQYSSGNDADGSIEVRLRNINKISRSLNSKVFNTIIGKTYKNPFEIAEVLYLSHIGNLPKSVSANEDINNTGYPEVYNKTYSDLVNNQSISDVVVGHGVLSKPESFDENESHVVTMTMGATKQGPKIPLSQFLLQIKAMGQEIDLSGVKMTTYPAGPNGKIMAEYNASIVRKGLSGDKIKGRPIRIFPKNILEQDREATIAFLDELIADSNAYGNIYTSRIFNFLNFNKSTLKSAINPANNPLVAGMAIGLIKEQPSRAKNTTPEIRGDIYGKKGSSEKKELEQMRAFVKKLRDHISGLAPGELPLGGMPLFMTLDKQLTSITANSTGDPQLRFKSIDFLEVDRDFGKHHLTWFKINQLGDLNPQQQTQVQNEKNIVQTEAQANKQTTSKEVTENVTPTDNIATSEKVADLVQGDQTDQQDEDYSDLSPDQLFDASISPDGNFASRAFGERIINNILGEDFVNGNLEFKPLYQLPDGRTVYGYLKNGAIALAYRADGRIKQTTPRHEALHHILVNLVDPNSYSRILLEAEFRSKLAGESIPSGRIEKERFLLEYISDLYSETYDLGIFDRIPGIIGDLIRWLHGMFRKTLLASSELDYLMADAELGEWRNITPNSDPNFVGDLYSSSSKSGDLNIDDMSDVKNSQPVDENTKLEESVPQEERERKLQEALDSNYEIREKIFGGSDYVMKFAENTLKGNLIKNSPYSTDFAYEIIHSKLSDDGINRQINKSFKQITFFAEQARNKHIEVKIGDNIYNNYDDLIGSKDLLLIGEKSVTDKEQYITVLRDLSIIALSNRAVFARMTSSLYNISLDRVLKATQGKLLRDVSLEQELLEADAVADIFERNLQEFGDNAIYKEARTIAPIDRLSKTLRFIMSSIPVIKVNRRSDGSVESIERTSSFVNPKMIDGLFDEIMQTVFQLSNNNPDAFAAQVEQRIAQMPEGDAKNIAESVFYRFFHEYGITSDLSNEMPVFSYNALMKLDPDQIWMELVQYEANRLNIDPSEIIGISIGSKRIMDRNIFDSIIMQKKKRASAVYHSFLTYLMNVKHQSHQITRVSNIGEERNSTVRVYGHNSEEGYAADLRRYLEEGILFREESGDGIVIDTKSIFFGNQQDLLSNINSDEFKKKRVLINSKGIYIVRRIGKDKASFIKIVDFNEDGTFDMSDEYTNNQAEAISYIRMIFQGFGLKGDFLRSDIFGFFMRESKNLKDKKFLPNMLGMYAALMHRGINAAANVDEKALNNLWSAKYKEGPVGADQMFKPLPNDKEGIKNFSWPSDLAQANKTLAGIVLAKRGYGFPGIVRDVKGKPMQTKENGSAILKALPPAVEKLIIGKDGSVEREKIESGKFYPLLVRRRIASGYLIRSGLEIDLNKYPNTFVNPIPGTEVAGRAGIIDEIVDVFDSNGLSSNNKSQKDNLLSAHDELVNMAITFDESLSQQKFKTKDFEYVFPVAQFGDKETKYAKVRLGGAPLIDLKGQLNSEAIAIRIKEIFKARQLESTDSRNMWANFMGSNGYIDPNEASKLAPVNTGDGVMRISGEEFNKIISSRLNEIQSSSDRIRFFREIRNSDLVEGLDYTISKEDGKSPVIILGRAATMKHEIFNENNINVILSSSKEELPGNVERVMGKFVRRFAYYLNGQSMVFDEKTKEFYPTRLQNSVIFKLPERWAKVAPYVISPKEMESQYDGGENYSKLVVNPFVTALYFGHFIAHHQIISIEGGSPYLYKDGIEKQKRISQLVTPVVTASDIFKVFGDGIKISTFEDVKASEDFVTGIGTTVKASDISETDGYAIMHPIAMVALKRVFGDNIGVLNNGHLKMLLYNAGGNKKASWARITDQVLYNADPNDPDGFNPWNFIRKMFLDKNVGEEFVRGLQIAIEESKDKPIANTSIIDTYSENFLDQILETNKTVSDVVASFAISTEGVKTYRKNISRLTDEQWSFTTDPMNMFGMINDPSQDIEDSPTASSNIQQITQTAWVGNDEVGEIQNIWASIIKAQHRTKSVEIEEIKNRSMAILEKTGVAGNTVAMFQDKNISINLPGLSFAITQSQMNQFSRSIARFRTPGSRLTQAPARWFRIIDENGKERKLKPVKFDPKNGVVEKGEAILPAFYLDQFIPKEEQLLMGKFITPEMVLAYITDEATKASFRKMLTVMASRVPSGGLNSGFPLNVVGFVNDNENIIYLPSAQNVLNGADYDIDQLQVWVYKPVILKSEDGTMKTLVLSGDPNDPEATPSSLINTMLDKLINIYDNPQNMQFTGSVTSLDVPNLVKEHFQLESRSGQSGERDALAWIGSDDLTGHLVRKGIVSQGSEAIGIVANLSKATSLVITAEKLNPGSVLNGIKFSEYAIQEIDKWLNSGLDNEKHFILGVLNANPRLLEFIVAYVAMRFDPNKKFKVKTGPKTEIELQGAGHTFMDIGNIFKSQIMRTLIRDIKEMDYVVPNSDTIPGGESASILGRKMDIIDLLELQKKRIANGSITPDFYTVSSKLSKEDLALLNTKEKTTEINDKIRARFEAIYPEIYSDMLDEIDSYVEIAAVGQALNRIASSAILTSTPKDMLSIERHFFNLSSMIGYDSKEYFETGNKNQLKGNIPWILAPYAPVIGSTNIGQTTYITEKENKIRSLINFDGIMSIPVFDTINQFLYLEYKKNKEVFVVDNNDVVYEEMLRFYNQIMFRNGFISENSFNEMKEIYNKYLTSLYFTMNGDKINLSNENQSIINSDINIDETQDQGTVNLSNFDLTTYHGRQAYMLTFPLWLESKIQQFKNQSPDNEALIDTNLFRQYVKLDKQNGITVYKIENMSKVSMIQDELKQDTYKLFNAIDPTGNTIKAARIYHMLLNGMSYGKGSMSVVFKPEEFYDYSDWVESTLVPAILNPNEKVIPIGRRNYSFSDLIRNDLFNTMAGYMQKNLTFAPEKEPEVGMGANKFVSGWKTNVFSEKELIEMASKVFTYHPALDFKYQARDYAPVLNTKKKGVIKIKQAGDSSLYNHKYRSLGYNVDINPLSIPVKTLDHPSFTELRTIKSVSGDAYVSLLNKGEARIAVPMGSIEESINTEVVVDGVVGFISGKSEIGQIPYLKVAVSNISYNKIKLREINNEGNNIAPELKDPGGNSLINPTDC